MNPKLYLTYKFRGFFSKSEVLRNRLLIYVSIDKILIRKIDVDRHNLNGKKFTKGTTACLLLCLGASRIDYQLPVVTVDMSLRSFLAPIQGFDRINMGL